MVPGHATAGRQGMTMIELSIVMAIASVLLAMVLGLSRYVDHTVKMRRAQAELGVWHEALEQWHQRFESYPYTRHDTSADSEPENIFSGIDWKLQDAQNLNHNPLATLTNRCEMLFQSDNFFTNITFSSFITHRPSTVDPWGTPYVYIPGAGGTSYTLYSCGPDRSSQYESRQLGPGTPHPNTNNGTYDDVYMVR